MTLSPRILFVLLWRAAPYPGTDRWGGPVPGAIGDPGVVPLSHGLSNSAGFVVQMLLDAGLEANLVHVGSDNDIWKGIEDYAPTDVVIEAFWMRPKKLDDLGVRYPDIRFVIRGHSSTPFLAQDTNGFPWLLDYLRKPNGIVAPNDRRHLDEVRQLARLMFPEWDGDEVHRRVPYLPNYYPMDHEPKHHHLSGEKRSFVEIGCFGAARPMKNMVGQAIAALDFARRQGLYLHFHINGDRIESGGGPTVRALEAIFEAVSEFGCLVRHNWMPHAEFLNLVRSMDIVMQVSFAETFCIVAADALSEGVPLVCSKEVPWAPRMICADPTDPVQMAEKLRMVWQLKHIGLTALPETVRSLRVWNERARAAWLELFDR